MAGQPRRKVLGHPGLVAVEARCFQNEERRRKRKRAVDLLDGTDQHFPKLSVYQASDNPDPKGGHGVAGITELSSYFKIEEINLDSLRQCFLDPDVRIRQHFEFELHDYPRIGRVTISSGFLEEQTVVFNQGLNSILGGKGTGKSLLVELLRFALNQAPESAEIKRDHDSKLNYRLEDFGVVHVEFIDETGQVFNIRRTLDPSSNGYEDIEYDPSEICQVLFLSQNEIIRIAEDESLQLDFIDRFSHPKHMKGKLRHLKRHFVTLTSRWLTASVQLKKFLNSKNRLQLLKSKSRDWMQSWTLPFLGLMQVQTKNIRHFRVSTNTSMKFSN